MNYRPSAVETSDDLRGTWSYRLDGEFHLVSASS